MEKEEIMLKYNLMKDVEGNILMQEDNVVVVNKSNGELLVLPAEDAKEVYGDFLKEVPEKENNNLSNSTNSNNKTNWPENATFMLISQYKEHEWEFKSNSHRNDDTYKKISKMLNDNGFKYTSTQCKDRFKYLKMKYMKKRDSMKTTGASPVSFTYFQEMDLLFRKKPNVEPIASSSRDTPLTFVDKKAALLNDDMNDLTEMDQTRKTSSKKRKYFQRGEVDERRHQEKLQLCERLHNDFLQTYKESMDKLLEKL